MPVASCRIRALARRLRAGSRRPSATLTEAEHAAALVASLSGRTCAQTKRPCCCEDDSDEDAEVLDDRCDDSDEGLGDTDCDCDCDAGLDESERRARLGSQSSHFSAAEAVELEPQLRLVRRSSRLFERALLPGDAEGTPRPRTVEGVSSNRYSEKSLSPTHRASLVQEGNAQSTRFARASLSLSNTETQGTWGWCGASSRG